MKIAQSNSVTLSKWITDLHEFQLDSIFDTVILGRAYDYISKVTNVSIQENKVSCQIAGTNIYEINIEMVGNVVKAVCNCPYDQKCKHMAATILSLMDIDWDAI